MKKIIFISFILSAFYVGIHGAENRPRLYDIPHIQSVPVNEHWFSQSERNDRTWPYSGTHYQQDYFRKRWLDPYFQQPSFVPGRPRPITPVDDPTHPDVVLIFDWPKRSGVIHAFKQKPPVLPVDKTMWFTITFGISGTYQTPEGYTHEQVVRECMPKPIRAYYGQVIEFPEIPRKPICIKALIHGLDVKLRRVKFLGWGWADRALFGKGRVWEKYTVYKDEGFAAIPGPYFPGDTGPFGGVIIESEVRNNKVAATEMSLDEVREIPPARQSTLEGLDEIRRSIKVHNYNMRNNIRILDDDTLSWFNYRLALFDQRATERAKKYGRLYKQVEIYELLDKKRRETGDPNWFICGPVFNGTRYERAVHDAIKRRGGMPLSTYESYWYATYVTPNSLRYDVGRSKIAGAAYNIASHVYPNRPRRDHTPVSNNPLYMHGLVRFCRLISYYYDEFRPVQLWRPRD